LLFRKNPDDGQSPKTQYLYIFLCLKLLQNISPEEKSECAVDGEISFVAATVLLSGKEPSVTIEAEEAGSWGWSGQSG
jgi:hypothetical protein